MSFFDNVSRKVKAKAVEWDVQGRAEKLAADVEKAAHDAKDKAAEYADDNRGKVRENLDKVGARIDERTDGKYADRVAKAKQSVAQGVDRLADQRPGGSVPPQDAAPGSAPTSPRTGAAAGYAEPYQPDPYRPDPIDPAEPIERPVDDTVDQHTAPRRAEPPQDRPPVY